MVDLFVMDNEHENQLLYAQDVDALFKYDQAKGIYRMFTDRKLEQYVYRFLKYKINRNITWGMIKDLAMQIKMSTERSVDEITVSPYIALEDCLLNLETFKFSAFDLEKIATHNVPFSKQTLLDKPKTPVFTAFLDSVIVDRKLNPDYELQFLVQEMCGFYFLNNLKAEAVFFLYGQGMNGKSTIMNILQELIGKEFYSAATIESLTKDKWGPVSLIGKKINFCRDEESRFLASDKFKTMISGEPTEIEKKYGSKSLFTPTAKHLFSLNHLPKFDMLDRGLLRRIKIIPFYHNISESKKDTDLGKKLKAELPGIFAWAIEGAKRLVENGYKFSEAKAVEEMKYEFQEMVSAAILFFRERYQLEETGFSANEDMYREYTIWCTNNGRKPMNSNNFFKDLINNIGLQNHMKWSSTENKTIRGKKCIPIKETKPYEGEQSNL